MRVRSVIPGALGLLVSLLLTAGCTAGQSPDVPLSATREDPPGEAVTIRHSHGTTTVPRPPRRVVTLGSTDTQVAAALDVPIVAAVRDPTRRDGNWPGVAPVLSSDVAVLDDDLPDLERIALARPDLILAVSATGPYLDAYDQLSRIAPVLAPAEPTGDTADSGEQVTRTIGQALFRYDEALDLIADSDADLDRFAADHPELAGATYALGLYGGGQAYLDATPGSQSHQLLRRLGLDLAPQVTDLAATGRWNRSADGLVIVGPEHLDVLDGIDVVLVGTTGATTARELREQPVVAGTDLWSSGRLHLIGPGLTTSLLRPNPALTGFVLRSLGRLGL